MKPLARYIAPHLLRMSSAESHGQVGWIAGFTTQMAGLGRIADDHHHIHRCHFQTEARSDPSSAPVSWRLESQPLDALAPVPARVVVGEAATLQIAQEAALSSALRLAGSMAGQLKLGPACVALPRLPGEPRVWGCGAVVAPEETAEGEAAAIRLCFIRERLSHGLPRFICTWEWKERAGQLRLQHWSFESLADAVEAACKGILGQDVLRHSRH
ncbi:hypothetical protein [Roseomonas marmotae]|uniref:Uncharacterized protein n=1 Tax=Roseomonas marmotae TaxID=2768161 RepID=A0ABS3KF67_9PROT|nr:hypothetical protein [Roseomonas marmotae]MBO1076111.1 hypothetical protein [Roseomonas marmotae]QTI81347.1 hypothetical protein IAI58_18505 [Roseomonas marmotae]